MAKAKKDKKVKGKFKTYFVVMRSSSNITQIVIQARNKVDVRKTCYSYEGAITQIKRVKKAGETTIVLVAKDQLHEATVTT